MILVAKLDMYYEIYLKKKKKIFRINYSIH